MSDVKHCKHCNHTYCEHVLKGYTDLKAAHEKSQFELSTARFTTSLLRTDVKRLSDDAQYWQRGYEHLKHNFDQQVEVNYNQKQEIHQLKTILDADAWMSAPPDDSEIKNLHQKITDLHLELRDVHRITVDNEETIRGLRLLHNDAMANVKSWKDEAERLQHRLDGQTVKADVAVQGTDNMAGKIAELNERIQNQKKLLERRTLEIIQRDQRLAKVREIIGIVNRPYEDVNAAQQTTLPKV